MITTLSTRNNQFKLGGPLDLNDDTEANMTVRTPSISDHARIIDGIKWRKGA